MAHDTHPAHRDTPITCVDALVEHVAFVLVPMHLDAEHTILGGVNFGKTSEVCQVRALRKIRDITPCRSTQHFANQADRSARRGDGRYPIFVAEAHKVLGVDVEVFNWGSSGQCSTEY